MRHRCAEHLSISLNLSRMCRFCGGSAHWHGRAFEAKVMAQRVASVFCTEYTAPLQLGHHECHEVVEIARKQCRGENEAVAGLGLEPSLAVIGDLRRGADQAAAWGNAINELLHGEVF